MKRISAGRDLKAVPWNRLLTGLALLLALVSSLACNPNPQPEGLTPVPTLAPAATLTLIPAMSGVPVSGGEVAPTAAPAGGDAANGAAVFGLNCAVCHAEDAAGGSVGPTLISAEMKAKADDYYRQTLVNGISGTAMPAWSGRLSAQEIEDVIAFLRSKQ